ncbi:MAG: hypothetical protein RLZZ601_1552 [Pseudomonadota bacterium]|jgi:hypothetical protein
MRQLINPNFLENPFFLLSASPRDGKSRIIELADEMALSADSELCNKARSDLTSPRNRIAHEISWFTGVSPKKAHELSIQVVANPKLVLTETSLPPLVLANLWTALFEAFDDEDDAPLIAEAVVKFANLLEQINASDILRDLNEDRLVSGFPEIASLDLVEEALAERKKVFRVIVRDALNRLSIDKLIEVTTEFASEGTFGGETNAPEFIYSLIDAYEVETQGFLNNEFEGAQKLCAAVLSNAASGSSLEPNLSSLNKVSRNFAKVAKPIQLAYKSRGLEHDLSKTYAYEVRSLAIDLHNKHNQLDTSLELTKINRELFSDIPEFVDRVDEDEEILVQFKVDKNKRKEDDQQWASDITYSAEIGLVFKEALTLSPKGASYGGKTYPLDSITRIGWGAVRNSVNGIPTGTDYTIFFGDANTQATVSTKRQNVYQEFTDKLWKAVGIRIITEMAAYLKAGNSMNFREMTVWDDRVTLKRHKMFGAEDVTCPWSELQIWSSGGSLYLGHTKDNKIYSTLPYLKTANAHVLEMLIRAAFKKPGMTKLSQTFE